MDGQVFVYYISGHGFGHATRSGQLAVSILEQNLTSQADIDPVMVQPLAYTVDRESSVQTASKFLETREELIMHESQWLKSIGATCVLIDSPSAPCAAAHRAGVPSVIISNFTFDEIYYGLKNGDLLEPQLHRIAETFESDYRKARLLVRTPGFIRIPSFEECAVYPLTEHPSEQERGRVILDAPMYFREHRREKFETLDDLKIPRNVSENSKILLFSFGGQALSEHEWTDVLPPGWICIVVNGPLILPPSFYAASRETYVPDLVHASDVVLGKLGYGTISECIGHSKPMIYVPRIDFIEEEGLLTMMRDQGSCKELSIEKFEKGDWQVTT
ncbi:hypothetical protein PROFUN_10475 [Planoprotostelium fungivorum]|uniref:Uncharacterized protein n=1 Tax=Planoprotostelium fungivorum TaxID=1890364 RepID=A0A2P6NDH3_9EUKA|nr:hypothetical protein PROFUN_10475 [Planoprotostelium fungivorum]